MTAVTLPKPLVKTIMDSDSARTCDVILAMSDAERRPLLSALAARSRTVGVWSGEQGPLLVAGLACVSTPTQAAAWFLRRSLQWAFSFRRENVVLVQANRVLAGRDVAWLADFAIRIADGLPDDNRSPERWDFIADLIRRSDARMPTGTGFIRGWAWRLTIAPEITDVADDPLLPALLPRLFDVDGIGEELGRSPAPRTKAVSMLGQLVQAGRVDRSRVLAGTLSRLRLGDNAPSIRYFVKLHNELSPTTDETAPLTGDYLALLPEAPAPVATMAQKILRTLDEAKALDLADLVTASEAVLSRTEAALVNTQLSWVDKVLTRHPAADLVATVADAFGHPKLAITERAVTIAVRHQALLDVAGRDRIADATTLLPFDLQERFTGRTAVEDEPIALVASARRSIPAPITTPVEFAGAVVAHLAAASRDTMSAVELERLLDALIRLAWQDRAALVAALTPVRDRDPEAFDPPSEYLAGRGLWIPAYVGAAIAAVFPDLPARHSRRALIIRRSAASPVLDYRGEAPAIRVIATRLDEIVDRFPSRPIPFLLATPTEADGHIAASALVERLSAYEAQVCEPWPYDFEQALLRLPWVRDEAAIAAAAALTSSAGRRLARWLETGPPGVISERRIVVASDRRGFFYRRTTLPPSERPSIVTEPDGDDLGVIARLMLTTSPQTNARPGWHRPWPELWPSVLPSHREAIAAQLVPYLRVSVVDDTRGCGAMLPLLAETTGPAGPAMALVIAYGFGARDLTDRTGAIDAAVELAATGDLDATGLGRDLGDLCADGSIKLTRVVEALAELARIGAADAVGAIAIAALGTVLTATKVPPGAADLMELASRHYRPAGPVDVTGLAAAAGRTGISRTVVEARRLHRLLTSA